MKYLKNWSTRSTFDLVFYVTAEARSLVSNQTEEQCGVKLKAGKISTANQFSRLKGATSLAFNRPWRSTDILSPALTRAGPNQTKNVELSGRRQKLRHCVNTFLPHTVFWDQR